MKVHPSEWIHYIKWRIKKAIQRITKNRQIHLKY